MTWGGGEGIDMGGMTEEVKVRGGKEGCSSTSSCG